MAGTSAARSRYIDVEVVQRLLKTVDFLSLSIGGLYITMLAARFSIHPDVPALVGFYALTLVLAVMLVIRTLGLYDVSAFVNWARTTAVSVSAGFIVGAVLYAITKFTVLPLASNWLMHWFLLLACHFVITRGAAASWASPMSASGRFRKRIAIVGGGKAAENAIHTLESSPGLDVEIVGLFDDRYDERSPESIRSHRKIGKIAELAEFARTQRIDLIIVAIPLSAEARLLHILKRLWELPVDIKISGQASSLKLSPRAYTQLGYLPLLAVFDRPLSGWNSFLKGVLDRIIALVAIVLLSPVMLATAVAVKLESKGPIIFRQRRYGFNNELIEVYKFRSMYTNLSDATASKLVTKNDPRVTRVGRIIRKTSLDELPQLFNVLTGQLSIVGPRPHATQAKAADALYEQVADGYFARHKVKPGITGWAQINGWRGETDTREKLEQRVKHDLEYIDRWSLWFDIYIVLKTPFALLKSENAY
jgi:Undecaprenyl-phosphate glucose phosphotransferase